MWMACTRTGSPGISRRRRTRRKACLHNRQVDSRIAPRARCNSLVCSRTLSGRHHRRMSQAACSFRSSTRCCSRPATCHTTRPGSGRWSARTERRHSGWPRFRRRSCQTDRCRNRARRRSRPAQTRIRRPTPRRSAAHSRTGSPCRRHRTPSAASSSRTTTCLRMCRTRCRRTRRFARMSWACIATFHTGWVRLRHSSARKGTRRTGPYRRNRPAPRRSSPRSGRRSSARTPRRPPPIHHHRAPLPTTHPHRLAGRAVSPTADTHGRQPRSRTRPRPLPRLPPATSPNRAPSVRSAWRSPSSTKPSMQHSPQRCDRPPSHRRASAGVIRSTRGSFPPAGATRPSAAH
jgi:hypothetical protein